MYFCENAFPDILPDSGNTDQNGRTKGADVPLAVANGSVSKSLHTPITDGQANVEED